MILWFKGKIMPPCFFYVLLRVSRFADFVGFCEKGKCIFSVLNKMRERGGVDSVLTGNVWEIFKKGSCQFRGVNQGGSSQM